MSRTRQEIEALADIFIGDIPTAPARPDRLVLLVEGHLPVRGALWRHAAAKMVAGAQGGTLLELDDREMHVVRFGDEPLEATTLEHVVAAPAAGHLWMVAGFAAGISPAATSQIGEIVLLTGGDQAAVVGAYRAVKQVVQARAGEPLSVGVILAGSSPAAAEEVWGRLSNTFREHLGLSAELGGVLSQIDAAAPPQSVTLPMPADGLPAVLNTIEARPAGTTGAPVAADDVAIPVSPVTLPPPPRPVASTPDPLPESQREEALPEGLRAFRVATPVPAGVTIAVGRDGGVHVVAAADAIGNLERSRCWASKHLALMAAADAAINPNAPVTCHVLVDDFHQAADLAAGPWKVHFIHGSGLLEVPRPPADGI